MSDIAIQVDGVSKSFQLGEAEPYRMLRDSVINALKAPYRWMKGLGSALRNRDRESGRTLWALRDVGFEVRRGEVLGVIGGNGAGKSTLLKILSRITEPSEGEINIFGRVGSLLEVGTGFHPELTGRENVYMNGAILGMSRREITAKFDEIVAFAGVEKFIDTPVKRYSSGMGVRLGFAVAAHLEPEILIVDEVLAVGDAEFQTKCLAKMNSVSTSGRTILFVSHNMAAIRSLCTRALVLRSGSRVFTGNVDEAVRMYLAPAVDASGDLDFTDRRSGVIKRIRICDAGDNTTTSVEVGGELAFELTMKCEQPVLGAQIIFTVVNEQGYKLFNLHTRFQHPHSITLRDTMVVRCNARNCRLAPGIYHVHIQVKSGWDVIDHISTGITFQVNSGDVYGTGRLPPAGHGLILPEAAWTILPSVRMKPI